MKPEKNRAGRRSNAFWRWILGGILALGVVPAVAAATLSCLIDDHTRPLPGPLPAGWYYNATGGDRGMLSDMIGDPNGCAEYTRASSTSYRATVKRLTGSHLWEYAGMWYALSHPIAVKQSYPATALFPAAILPAYQPQLIGMEVVVNAIQSPDGRSDLSFNIEVKGFDGDNAVTRFAKSWSGADLQGSYPKTFSVTWDPATLGSVSYVSWLLDRAVPDDSIEVDSVRLLAAMPDLDIRDEAFVTSLAMLLDNYDPTTGMLGDRSNFPSRDFENVTAAAKLVKLLAFGIEAGVCDRAGATAIITHIARTLLEVVPAGPAGIDALWPHFTKGGGTQAASGSEWASGDTAYALLDLAVGLQLVGDPTHQLPAVQAHLRAIRWDLLKTADGGFSHGYDTNGVMLASAWKGFGTEYLGVALAALAGGNVMGAMGPPPTDNGCGFILHAGYPLVPCGADCWTNDWPRLRWEDSVAQTGWYASVSNSNPRLSQLGLFGLSAAERPEGHDATNHNERFPSYSSNCYQAYGIGGRYTPPNDGEHNIVVLHYSAMVADLQRTAATQMWARLKSMGIVSPLNNLESMSVNPATGTIEEINYLKGSWNLALQAEGWAWTYPAVARAAYQAVAELPALARAWQTLFPAATVAPRPVAADFDDDGLADPALVTSNGWYVCLSGQRYAAQGPFAMLMADATPLAADFDGDGKADPFMINCIQWTAWLSAYAYTSITGDLGVFPGAASLGGDMDGDRIGDVAAYTPSGWTAWMSRAAYAEAGPFPLTRTNATPVLADFDGDGLADPAVVTAAGWTIWPSSHGYPACGPYPLLADGGVPLAADFDGDRRADPAMVKDGVWTVWLSGQAYVACQWSPGSADDEGTMSIAGTYDAIAATAKSGGGAIYRSNAGSGQVWHLDQGQTLRFDFSNAARQHYLLVVRYSNDDLGTGDTVSVQVNGTPVDSFTTQDTGNWGHGWNVFVNTPPIPLGELSGTCSVGLQILTSDGYGVDFDTLVLIQRLD